MVAAQPDGAEAKIYREIATRVRQRLEEENAAGEAPAIVFE